MGILEKIKVCAAAPICTLCDSTCVCLQPTFSLCVCKHPSRVCSLSLSLSQDIEFEMNRTQKNKVRVCVYVCPLQHTDVMCCVQSVCEDRACVCSRLFSFARAGHRVPHGPAEGALSQAADGAASPAQGAFVCALISTPGLRSQCACAAVTQSVSTLCRCSSYARPHSQDSKTGEGFEVTKFGDGRVALIGEQGMRITLLA